MLSDEQIVAITDHIARHVGEPEEVLHELIPQDLHIDIHVVSPTPKRNYLTFVTSGDEAEEERFNWPLFWLETLARAPHQYGTWFGPGHTIPNGDPPEPLGEGVDFRCAMLRNPVTTPAGFAALTTRKKTIHFYAFVPIYRDEMDFALSEGHEALAARLDAAGVTELLDVRRPSVCRSAS